MRRVLPVAIVAVLIAAGVVISLSVGGGGGSQAQVSTVFVGPEVWEALEEQRSVSVLIGLREPDVPLAERTTDLRRQNSATRQARVLASLTASDFTLEKQLEISAALSGEITQSGLEKLAVHPDVVSIGLNCCGGAFDIRLDP